MQESVNVKPRVKPVQWIAAVLLVLVGYVHLSLVVNTFGLHGRLGILFALNALGALAALILIFTRFRVAGWILGIVVAGGAAFAKLGMGSIPGLRTWLMGRTFPGRRFPGGGFPRSQRGNFANGTGSGIGTGAGNGGSPNFANGSGSGSGSSGSFGSGSRSGFGQGFGSHAGHFAARHTVLPTFFNLRSLGTVAIVIEILFVLLAVYALVSYRGSSTPPSVESNG